MVYFGALICPFGTKSLLRLHGFLLIRLFFQSLKNRLSRGPPVVSKPYCPNVYTVNNYLYHFYRSPVRHAFFYSCKDEYSNYCHCGCCYLGKFFDFYKLWFSTSDQILQSWNRENLIWNLKTEIHWSWWCLNWWWHCVLKWVLRRN